MSRWAYQAAIASERIHTRVVEIGGFPALAALHGVRSVPRASLRRHDEDPPGVSIAGSYGFERNVLAALGVESVLASGEEAPS